MESYLFIKTLFIKTLPIIKTLLYLANLRTLDVFNNDIVRLYFKNIFVYKNLRTQ